jgi:hypothetical protein
MSDSLKMNGQWIGDYTGATGGKIIVNIDERESMYQGVAYLLPGDFKTLPATVAFFKTANKDGSKFEFRTTSILAIDPDSLVGVQWESVKHRFPNIAGFSKYADVSGVVDGDFLRLSWKSDLEATGECVLPRSAAGKPSELDAKKMNWPEYKEYVASLKGRRYLFRGQDGSWRLRTSFHRTGRADLNRFLAEDILNLVKHLSARTKHFFKLDVPDELGAFFNLVQHHGYPTPLLDWTYSPYVAAFFAYRRAPRGNVKRPEASETVRIHVLKQEQWRNDWQQLLLLLFPGPHVSIAEFISIENERMIPQQAASTLSSVDDIETYIRSKETENKKYLSAIDLPVLERDRVMEDLSYMGITAGSLFPGIDGACEELRERNFS